MFSVNDKVKFNEGLWTKVVGDVTFTVTDVYNKGDELPTGQVYNGPDELYRLVADDPSVPKELRVTYQKECSIHPADDAAAPAPETEPVSETEPAPVPEPQKESLAKPEPEPETDSEDDEEPFELHP